MFGGEDNIDFPTQMSTMPTTKSGFEERNFSEMSASNKSERVSTSVNDDDDDLEHSFSDITISYIDDDDVMDFPKSVEVDESVLAEFEKNLDLYREQNEFGKVADLLESARNKAIDDDRYYFERLRCYFENKDEDGFYAFYDEVEYTIQRFPEDWNRKISEMVIQLGQK